MGIRLECPNGHKLHVKSYLAGKRGICPDCGAKFIIPSASQIGLAETVENGLANDETQRPTEELREPIPDNTSEPAAAAPAAQTTTATVVSQENVASAAPAEPVPPVADVATPPIAQPPETFWFVRPPSGGQFGPVIEDTLKSWIAEGRITEDALLWCNGWPEWKLARDVAEQLPVPLVAKPVAAQPEPPEAMTSEPPPAPADGEPAASALSAEVDPAELQASHVRARRRRAQQTRLKVTWILLVAVIALAGLLIWVLVWGAG